MSNECCNSSRGKKKGYSSMLLDTAHMSGDNTELYITQR